MKTTGTQRGTVVGRATALPRFCLGYFFRAHRCMINGGTVTSNACLPDLLALPLKNNLQNYYNPFS